MWYNIYVRQRGNPDKKGSEEMTEGMTENQTKRLIEWLKANGMTAEKIVECMDYINTNQSNKKG